MSIPELLNHLKSTHNEQDAFETEGRKHNREIFTIELDGQNCHDLIEYLRNRAQHSEAYLETRNCVIWAETIYQQIRKQGF